MQRIAHPGRIVVLAVFVVMLLAASFVAGRFFSPPQQDAVKAAGQNIDVWAPVTMSMVNPLPSFPGTVSEGSSVQVLSPAIPAPAVVVAQGTKVGDRLRGGSMIASISGKPYFGLVGPLALYRDLVAGDQGEDVKTLQKSLVSAGFSTRTDGFVDWSTIQAVVDLFRGAGYAVPSREKPATVTTDEKAGKTTSPPKKEREVVIPFNQFIAIPQGGGTVMKVIKVGTPLTDATPLATIRTSEPFVQFIADVDASASLKRGQKVSIQGPGADLQGKIASVGDFVVGKDGQRSGHAIRVSFKTAKGTDSLKNQSVTVKISTSKAAKAVTAVPATAMRQDSQGAFVLVQSGVGGEKRVAVTEGASDGGLVAVDGDLQSGQMVKVS